MQSVTVTFERIFDLHRRDSSKSNPRHTAFGFVADGKPHYAVSVPSWPTIEVGTTVTAFLREEGNWQSLRGWVNHQTRETVFPDYRRSIFSTCISGVITLLVWMGPLCTGVPNLSSAEGVLAYLCFFLLAFIMLVLGS